MDSYSHHHNHHMFERRAIPKSRAPPVKWVKEWVPQDLLADGGKCMILKWVNEATFKALKEKREQPEASEAEPEQTSEVLFLCNYEGCGKTFIDATLLKKHSHIHGERQFICHYENCGKKFLDSSKLKRHFLIHTGERDYVCPHAGCGKAFSLDFNLRSHMKTHSQENYHICPYPECGKRYAHEYKLRNHVMSQHEKNLADLPKYTIAMPEPKPVKTPRASAVSYTSQSPDRPYVCPYDGCEKAYIHEYKLNLHLRREHPGHFKDDTPKNGQSTATNGAEETSDQEVYLTKRTSEKTKKQSSRSKPSQNLPPAKIARKGSNSNSNPSPANTKISKKAWLRKEVYGDNDDSEETEEEEEREETWRYRPTEEDDEETEDED